MAKNNSNLVRPRTAMHDSPTSLSSQHNHHIARKRPRSSIKELILCGTCMFLFILCVCLLVTLLLVGHSLQNGLIYTNYSSEFKQTDKDNNIWYKILDIATTKIFNNKHLLQFSNYNNKTNSKTQNSTDIILRDSIKINQNMSKVIQHLSWRLPREIKPKHYELFLYPNFNTQTYSGNVSIQLDIIKPISFIPIHSKYLNISSTEFVRNSVADNSTNSIQIAKTFSYDKFEYWVTEFEKPLEIGEYTITLAFDGTLLNRIVGFYQSSYRDIEQNRTRYIATSKFEPTYARQAFPCFDEPSMKANFSIKLVSPAENGYSALSNMNQIGEPVDGLDKQTKIFEFGTSVPMSTYLACFIVSDFRHKKKEVNASEIGKNFDIRVFSTPAQLNKVDFALETAVKMTEYYIQYFKIEYPLPKLDLAAIPDFVSGAMEHWGLVTFRETALLFDEKSSSTNNKQRVAQVIAHELAHMWFGNLVTMAWWNDLWLNEGFANYLQYKSMDKVFSNWTVLDDFIVETLQPVMVRDATFATHPIVQVAENPDQITELFDSITYSKGASVIRMLADYMGEENFQKGVTNYLTKYKFKNAVTDDFLTEMDIVDSNKDTIKPMMKTWTEQSGFPVLMVMKKSSTEYELKQKRFLSNPKNAENQTNDSPFNYHWTIPVTYFTDKDTKVVKKLFKHEDLQETITVPESTNWIKINKNQVGFYRVNYEIDEWKKLSEALSKDLAPFSDADRAHLLNDAFSLAEAVQLDYNVPLDLTKYLEKETKNVPWSVAASKLLKMYNLLASTNNLPKLIKYIRSITLKPSDSLGWEPDTDLNKNKLRITVLNLACKAGLAKCLEEAGKRFEDWIIEPEKRPSPDIRSLVYTYGMKTKGTNENWEAIWKLFTSETDAQEKIKLMGALASVRDSYLLQKFVNDAYDENYVRGQDYFNCLATIAANPIGESIVWDYVRVNWQKLVNRFGLNERNLGRMIPSITSRFSTDIKLEEMKAFFDKYPNAGAGQAARKEALQNVENNIQWLKNNEDKVAAWLDKHFAENQLSPEMEAEIQQTTENSL